MRPLAFLEETLDAIKKSGISEKEIYLNRMLLLKSMENDLREQIHQESEQLFKSKLKRGEVCFKIFKDSISLNWEMGHKVSYSVPRRDRALRGENDEDIQLSLFNPIHERHYNDFEKKVAWYLDEQEAIKWWHRMIAKDDYYLQGWQKNKVYPDFLAYVDKENLDRSKISVIETKGDFLKGNDDTDYKKQLFEVLEKYVNRSIDVGSVETASEDEERMVFRILMEKNWEEDLTSIIS